MPAAGHWVYAAKKAGLNVTWIYEPGKSERKTIRANYPDEKYLLLEDDIEDRPDVIGGSPPCAGFSTAGGSFNTVERPVCDQILKMIELSVEVAPELILIENVPRFKTFQSGKYFYKAIKMLEGDYRVSWTFLWAKDFGSPQPRKRIFIAAGKHKNFVFPSGNKSLPVMPLPLKILLHDLENKPQDPENDHIWMEGEFPVFDVMRHSDPYKPKYTFTPRPTKSDIISTIGICPS